MKLISVEIFNYFTRLTMDFFVFFFFRFAAIRNTVQGKQEERLPFFSFAFPPWFKQVYPRAYANFVYNTQHLTTPFDIHRTIEKVLDFKTPKEGDERERAISLFDKVTQNCLQNSVF